MIPVLFSIAVKESIKWTVILRYVIGPFVPFVIYEAGKRILGDPVESSVHSVVNLFPYFALMSVVISLGTYIFIALLKKGIDSIRSSKKSKKNDMIKNNNGERV